MGRSGKSRSQVLGILSLLAALLALNTAAAFLLRGTRLDLTEERLFTLSPSVEALVGSIEEPIRLDLYWTQETGRGAPQLRAHQQRVREFLEELALMSNGKVILSVIDPEPFSAAEETARGSGIAPLTVDGTGGVVMLGLVVRGPTDQKEVLPYLAPDQEGFLEYEVARAILQIGRAKKPRIGLLSTIPTEERFDPRNPSGPTPGPVIFRQLRSLYEVVNIETAAEQIPEALDSLVLVHPRGLGQPLLKSIDTWVQQGKPLLLFFDPWCESDPAAAEAFSGAERGGTSSDLGSLPSTWGFTIPTDVVVGDLTYATRVRTRGPGGVQQTLNYVPWLSLSESAFAKNDPITSPLSMVNMMSVGAIAPLPGSNTTLLPIIESSADSAMIQTLKLGYFGEPDQLMRDHKPDGTRRVLAARVSGRGKTEGGTAAADSEISVVVIGDADLLSDQTWVTQESIGGMMLGYRTIADNAALVLNSLEVLSGSQTLSGLKSRGKYRRPFEVVEAMRREAEAKYLRRAQELQDQIRDFELKIAGLQSDSSGGAQMVMSEQQQEEIRQLNEKAVVARREQREVQHALRQDIERTGHLLMLLNVIAWPIIVAALLIMVKWVATRVAP